MIECNVTAIRAYFLIRKSEQDDLQDLIAPVLKGLSRGGATILLISVIPGGFLLHLSSGIVISLAHGYVWDKSNENKEAILAMMKGCLGNLQNGLRGLPLLPQNSVQFTLMQAQGDITAPQPGAPTRTG